MSIAEMPGARPPLGSDYSQQPFVLAWELTRACNLACVHCRAEAQLHRNPLELSTAEALGVIDDLARFGPPPALILTGGDPMRRGDLIDPPGDSAWDQLRSAAAIAPDDAGVLSALAEYDRRAQACFEDELAGNRLSRAQACLDARAVRDRGGDGLAPERRRLADRWLAFAEERLGANELALARRALESAQALDPTHPGLAVIAERLRRAGG